MPPSNKYDKKKKENQKEGEGGGTKGEPLICCVPAGRLFMIMALINQNITW
jgi:hypothetical protein